MYGWCWRLCSRCLRRGFNGSLLTTVSVKGVVLKGNVLCYISTEDADKINAGQKTSITNNDDSEIKGQVSGVGDIPMSAVEITSELKSDYLVEELVQGEFAVKITITPDKSALLNQYLGAVPGALQQIANIAVLMLGVMLIMHDQFTVGMLLAFQSFMSSFMAPVNSLIGVGQSVQEMRSAMERVEDVMNYKPDVEYEPQAQSDANTTN